jgi:hypothetical protein
MPNILRMRRIPATFPLVFMLSPFGHFLAKYYGVLTGHDYDGTRRPADA